MGAEAKTTLRLGRQTFAGTALLETDELRFRGEARLRIPLANIKAVDACNGELRVTLAEGMAVFGLGDTASIKWAERIRSPRSLADKLGVKAGMRIAVLGVEDENILSDIRARDADLTIGKIPIGVPMVLWRISRPASLSKLPSIVKSIARDGAIWVVHPRGDASVADTVIFGAATKAGLTYTKVVRFSETDTAEKLVIPKASR